MSAATAALDKTGPMTHIRRIRSSVKKGKENGNFSEHEIKEVNLEQKMLYSFYSLKMHRFVREFNIVHYESNRKLVTHFTVK